MVAAGQDDEASRILCDVARRLHAPRPGPPPELVPLTRWFEALALWKASVFCEAIYGRYRRGELGAEDARAAAFEQAVPLMAEAAAARL